MCPTATTPALSSHGSGVMPRPPLATGSAISVDPGLRQWGAAQCSGSPRGAACRHRPQTCARSLPKSRAHADTSRVPSFACHCKTCWRSSSAVASIHASPSCRQADRFSDDSSAVVKCSHLLGSPRHPHASSASAMLVRAAFRCGVASTSANAAPVAADIASSPTAQRCFLCRARAPLN